MFTEFLVNQIKKRGYDITRPGYSDRVSVIYRKIINRFKIDHILDVGANEGQYAQGMRKLGFKETISSFEPLRGVFEKLKKNSRGDDKWYVYNLALGNRDEELEINVAKNTVSSSLLEMLPAHINQEPDSIILSKEKIQVKKMDSIWKEYAFESTNIFLKLDVQGYEKNVLEGMTNSLNNISVVQLEMALIPLYKGELLLADMVQNMNSLGFTLYNVMGGFSNFETGQLFQVDGIFARSDLIH